MNNKKAFSFVELIVVITIIALISVIGISINNNYTERSKNSKITSDIQTLKNSLEAYKSETKTLPAPKGNQKFFDDSSNYVHYDDPTAYGVAGFITEDTIPKKYLGYLPVDPRTEQYYAYGKTLTGAIEFEIAGVNVKDGVYESRVVGDHTGKTGPYNLIREYNGPDFVYDRSRNNFPYNPDERIIKGKIGSFSGTVKVNTIEINDTWLASNELKAGDTIEVNAGGEAQIYYSDGSKSYLGDQYKASKLTLANMVYKDENNLFTKIQLALDYGTIWTKTSKLDPNSEFEIYTTDTEAAVRGTIFGVSKDAMTYVKVQTGSVEITKIAEINTPIDSIIKQLKSDDVVATTPLTIVGESANLVMIDGIATLSSNGQIAEIHIDGGTSQIYASLGAPLPTLPEYESLSNIQPEIKSIAPEKVILELPSSFLGDGMKIISGANTNITSSGTWDTNILTMTGLTGTQEIKICDSLLLDNCTKSVSVTTTLGYSSTCKFGELDFGDVGCVEQDASLVASGYTLVAYAPYDVAGDLNMYKQGGGTIHFSSGGNISFDDSNPENKGIKIMTDPPAGWLAYSGSELGLGSNFAVEMSVRGDALKRSTGYYFLFNTNNSIWAQLIQGNINFGSGTIKAIISSGSLTSLESNTFYKAIFTFDGSYKISFPDALIQPTSSNVDSITLIKNLYIGSTTSSTLQWNNIIDYVKIYKK